jgi:hypothetical protein
MALLRLTTEPDLKRARAGRLLRVSYNQCSVIVPATAADIAQGQDHCEGWAYLVQNEADERALRYYKTDFYVIHRCRITFLDQQTASAPDSTVNGLTFVFSPGEDNFDAMTNMPIRRVKGAVGSKRGSAPDTFNKRFPALAVPPKSGPVSQVDRTTATSTERAWWSTTAIESLQRTGEYRPSRPSMQQVADILDAGWGVPPPPRIQSTGLNITGKRADQEAGFYNDSKESMSRLLEWVDGIVDNDPDWFQDEPDCDDLADKVLHSKQGELSIYVDPSEDPTSAAQLRGGGGSLSRVGSWTGLRQDELEADTPMVEGESNHGETHLQNGRSSTTSRSSEETIDEGDPGEAWTLLRGGKDMKSSANISTDSSEASVRNDKGVALDVLQLNHTAIRGSNAPFTLGRSNLNTATQGSPQAAPGYTPQPRANILNENEHPEDDNSIDPAQSASVAYDAFLRRAQRQQNTAALSMSDKGVIPYSPFYSHCDEFILRSEDGFFERKMWRMAFCRETLRRTQGEVWMERGAGRGKARGRRKSCPC